MSIEGVSNSILTNRPIPANLNISENRETSSTNSSGVTPIKIEESTKIIPATPMEGTNQEENSEGTSNFNSANLARATASEAEFVAQRTPEKRFEITA